MERNLSIGVGSTGGDVHGGDFLDQVVGNVVSPRSQEKMLKSEWVHPLLPPTWAWRVFRETGTFQERTAPPVPIGKSCFHEDLDINIIELDGMRSPTR
jgi:hypothetical protein